MVTVSRARRSARFPSSVSLVVAMNPCPCGHFGDPRGKCRCSPNIVHAYQQRLSGPLLDRIDLFVELQAVELASLATRSPSESSEVVRGRVVEARRRQEQRGSAAGLGVCNAEIEVDQLERLVPIEPRILGYLARAATACGISARAWFRVIRVSRTLADLEGCEAVTERHVAEALSFRRALAESVPGRTPGQGPSPGLLRA